MKPLLRGLLSLVSSYGFAIILQGFLFLLTLLGTLEQGRIGLYEVQRKYFTSFFLLHELRGGLRFPLPGVYLLLILLAVNLTAGVFYRTRPSLKRLGIYVMHGGMLFMLLAGLVTHHFAVEGQMTLAPGESSNRFQSYHEWEMVLRGPVGSPEMHELSIDGEEFLRLGRSRERTFQSDSLPFDLSIREVSRNAEPRQAQPGLAVRGPVIEGFYLARLPLEKENERNLPGLHVTLADKQTGQTQEDLIWGGSIAPLTVEVSGHPWEVALRRKSWSVPFTLTLREFRHEYHPGTRMARTYESDVTKSGDGPDQFITIRMNEPLRHAGYTFFQSSFFEDPRTGVTSSTFAVVRNPADQWPLWACVVVTAGLLLHFGQRLARYLHTERVRQAESEAGSRDRKPPLSPAPRPQPEAAP